MRIIVSRADAGRNEGNPAGGRDHAASRGRNRSGPVAGGGLLLRPPCLARVIPGHRPVISAALDQVRRRLSRRTIQAARDHSDVARLSGEEARRIRQNRGPASGNGWNGVLRRHFEVREISVEVVERSGRRPCAAPQGPARNGVAAPEHPPPEAAIPKRGVGIKPQYHHAPGTSGSLAFRSGNGVTADGGV